MATPAAGDRMTARSVELPSECPRDTPGEGRLLAECCPMQIGYRVFRTGVALVQDACGFDVMRLYWAGVNSSTVVHTLSHHAYLSDLETGPNVKYARHKPEPTQPGNPHHLTKNQHVFPDASITRFEHAEKGITAILLDCDQRISNLRADNKLFCANRVWDQRAESGYMVGIENEFQFLARRLIAGDLRWLELMQPTITRFYVLWEQRAYYALNPVPATKLKGVTPAADMTKDVKERLEKAHVSYVDDGSTWPSRQMTGMRIQFNIDQRQIELAGLNWTLCRATPQAGEFLVPDRPVAFCIPLTPTMALVANSDLDLVGPADMQFINLHTLHMSSHYVFAHDLCRCFVTGRQQLTMPPLPRKLKLDLLPGVGVTPDLLS